MIDVTSSRADKKGMKRKRRFAFLELDIGRSGAAHRSFDLAREQIKPGVKASSRKPTCCRPPFFSRLAGTLLWLSDERHAVK
jgi:hypothetical protein